MKKMLSVILIMLFGSVGLAYGQSAKEAFKALKKVEARTETGVSYKDYPEVISDAKVEVDGFLRSKEAKKNSEVAEHMKKAMDYYLLAGDIWRMKFNRGNANDLIYPDTDEGRLVAKLYPKAKPRGSKLPAGVRSTPEMERSMARPVYFIPEILSNIWGDATKELKMASEYLKTD